MAGSGASGLADVHAKIRACGDELKAWGDTRTRPEEEEIKSLQNRLDRINRDVTTDESKVEYLAISKQLDDLLLKQEIYWAQRSRVAWLKHGDRNTKFFHSKSSQRQRQNYIKGIMNSQEQLVEEMEDIARVAVDYFNNLFSAGSCHQMEECLSTVSAKVTTDMQEMLSRDFTVDEIKEAVDRKSVV